MKGEHAIGHHAVDRLHGGDTIGLGNGPQPNSRSLHSTEHLNGPSSAAELLHDKDSSNVNIDEAQVCLDGASVSIADIVAIGRHGVTAIVDKFALQRLVQGRAALDQRLAGGAIIYGVNTGFGGSADTRTKQTLQLQRILVRELHYGLLPSAATARDRSPGIFDLSMELGTDWNCIPVTWTRAAISIRINSLLKGHSGVRPVIVERLCDLLNYNIIPVIPLRGSISASGDLSPLSYVGGAIQGKRTIRVFPQCDHLTAERAFVDSGLEPVVLQAKEGLAIVNGTAISCAAAALVLHDAQRLALLAQILTSMSVEALAGTVESFDPLFSQTRPHPGQVESARNIRAFLQESKLTMDNDGSHRALRQDRYSIRTAPQWIGPILEDFLLAEQQIKIEINSVTDNPIVSSEGELLNGGNFQAKAVTSAMEKVRQGLQGLGRLLYVQCTELINPVSSHGLPPNLVIDDPSISYIFKGADLNTAALLSELGFLANTVNHVQSAEMGNQALNSLALISARYTHTAVDVLSQLAAAHLIAVCQALDIRACYAKFLDTERESMLSFISNMLSLTTTMTAATQDSLWRVVVVSFGQTVGLDPHDRFPVIAKEVRQAIMDNAELSGHSTLLKAYELTRPLADTMRTSWLLFRKAYVETQSLGDATPFLSSAGQKMYHFVRKELSVPLLHTAVLETPPPETEIDGGLDEASTVGSYTAIVYRAIRNGRMANVLAEISNLAVYS